MMRSREIKHLIQRKLMSIGNIQFGVNKFYKKKLVKPDSLHGRVCSTARKGLFDYTEKSWKVAVCVLT